MTDAESRDMEARALLNTHEKVCAERYGNIWEALKDIKADMQADRVARSTSDATVHARFNTISGRMWAAVVGVCAAAVLGLGAVTFHLLTRGH